MNLKFDNKLPDGDDIDALVRDGADIAGLWLREATTDKQKEEMKRALFASDLQFRNLRRILMELDRTADQDQHDMTKPNWELRLARSMGYRRALQEVYRMIPRTRGQE